VLRPIVVTPRSDGPEVTAMNVDSALYLTPPRRPAAFARKPDVEVDCLGFAPDEPSPFKLVLDAAQPLAPGQMLRLRIAYEPTLLYLLLDGRSFGHWSERGADGEWTVDLLRLPS
jgi:hypothetical protein